MGERICVTPMAYFHGALVLLLLPLKWIISAATAVLIHELFHYAVVKLFRGTVNRVTIGVAGIIMEISELAPKQDLICALAGPAGSILLLLTWKYTPMIAFCAGVQGLFNLLPVYPLDGGRAIRDLSGLLFPDSWAKRICATVETVCLVLLLVLGGYGSVCLHLGILPVLIPLVLWLKVKGNEK